MEILDYVFGDNYLAASSLPPQLEKKAAKLREAGPVEDFEDPVRAALERARIDKVAIADGTKTLDKLFGESSELDAVRARLSKAAVDANFTPEAIRRATVLGKLIGEENELGPTGEAHARASTSSRLAKAGDWTWNASLGSTPSAHKDGVITQSWDGGSTSVFWKNGRIIASRIEYLGPEGATEIECFDGDGDEVDEEFYASLVA